MMTRKLIEAGKPSVRDRCFRALAILGKSSAFDVLELINADGEEVSIHAVNSALRRMARRGVAEKFGSWNSTRYVLIGEDDPKAERRVGRGPDRDIGEPLRPHYGVGEWPKVSARLCRSVFELRA